MHCSCLNSAQPFSSGGARAALALVRRNRRAARVRGESRGAPSRIGSYFEKTPHIRRDRLQAATNRLAPRRDARLKFAAPIRMFAFAPRF
jgi:hypothetical protein